MMEVVELGSAPYDEKCVQVSDDDYMPAMRDECKKYKMVLSRIFPQANAFGCFWIIKSNPHEFGSYLEVALRCMENEKSEAYAWWVQDNLPATWNDVEEKYFKYEPEVEEDDGDENHY